jgi:hypothetical protein
MAARDSPALQSLVSHVSVPRSAYRRVVVHNRVLTGLVFCQSVKVNVHGFDHAITVWLLRRTLR